MRALRKRGMRIMRPAGLRAIEPHVREILELIGEDPTREGLAKTPARVARAMEDRRPDLITGKWWKEERGARVFIDFNQNAPHKTVFGAWCVRARPGAQVSAPFRWDELPAIHPDHLTMATVPDRLAADGDPWAAIDAEPQSIEPLDLQRRHGSSPAHRSPRARARQHVAALARTLQSR